MTRLLLMLLYHHLHVTASVLCWHRLVSVYSQFSKSFQNWRHKFIFMQRTEYVFHLHFYTKRQFSLIYFSILSFLLIFLSTSNLSSQDPCIMNSYLLQGWVVCDQILLFSTTHEIVLKLTNFHNTRHTKLTRLYGLTGIFSLFHFTFTNIMIIY